MPSRLARALLLAAIRAYKRHVSPRKGFACAYRVHTGRASCSTLGYRAVARHGVFRGLGILDARLAQCRLKHERYGPKPAPRSAPRLPPSQAGFVDGDCGGCDGDYCNGGDLVEDVAGCLLPDDCCDDCEPCDRRRRRRKPVRERGRRGSPGASPPVEPSPAADVDATARRFRRAGT
ncbi:MAG TPA: membrane protein insertion efficiency factor YidD [Burkholderiaceae bacterium]